MGIFDGFFSLSQNVNKMKDDAQKEQTEGILDKVPELSLDMKDEDLLETSRKWEAKWKKFYQQVKDKQEEGERYWLGQHYNKVQYEENKRPIQDNVIFEALETFLPAVTKSNPSPVVSADATDEGQAIAKDVQKMLVYQADRLRFKLKIKKTVRFWAIYLSGIAKFGWSQQDNDIDMYVVRPQKMILDPDGTIDEDMTYTGQFIGEYKRDTAEDLMFRFPKSKKAILDLVKEDTGTQIQYTEWWTNKYCFWRLDNKILGKIKNPHWNYDIPAQPPVLNEAGKIVIPAMPPVKGNNHFLHPEMPYVFLSVFNLGKHPIDETSLLLQNLSNQDLINKRNRQIDKNIDGVNGGWVISGEASGLTKEQSAQAITAFRKGKGVWIPSGNPDAAVKRMMGNDLPAGVYEDRNNLRERLHDIFGISGSTARASKQQRLANGQQTMINQDISRYSGIIEYIEQFSDKCYNWMTQLMYVYYDENHSGSVIGAERATEWVEIKNSDLRKKLTVGVKEGSLIPKDEATLAAQAESMMQYNAIDPITLFDRLGFPNPKETAKKKWIWDNSPASLFAGDKVIQDIQDQAQLTQQETEQKQAHSQDQAHQNKIEEIAAKTVATNLSKPTDKNPKPSPVKK